MGFEKIFNLIKTYKNSIADIVFHGKRLSTFALRSKTKRERSLPPLLFSIMLEVLISAIKHEKETMHANKNGKIKPSLFP